MSDFTPERLLRLFCAAPNAFFRHDVDVSLSAAVKMARFAQLAGVQSTFFLDACSDFYNLFSREGGEALEAIRSCGHRIGLHVDYRNGSVRKRVAYDRALVDAGYPGMFSRVVSFHMPPDCVLWQDFEPDFESAYGSKWEGRYLADSRREFGPEKEALLGDGWQVNLHPEHWFA